MNRRDLLKRFAALPLLPAALRDNRAEPEPVSEPTPEPVAPSRPDRTLKTRTGPGTMELRREGHRPVVVEVHAFEFRQECIPAETWEPPFFVGGRRWLEVPFFVPPSRRTAERLLAMAADDEYEPLTFRIHGRGGYTFEGTGYLDNLYLTTSDTCAGRLISSGEVRQVA